MRFPLSRRWEYTTVLPEDNALAPFVNGVISGEAVLRVKRGALYRRRVWSWRGRWRLIELRDVESVAGTNRD